MRHTHRVRIHRPRRGTGSLAVDEYGQKKREEPEVAANVPCSILPQTATEEQAGYGKVDEVTWFLRFPRGQEIRVGDLLVATLGPSRPNIRVTFVNPGRDGFDTLAEGETFGTVAPAGA